MKKILWASLLSIWVWLTTPSLHASEFWSAISAWMFLSENIIPIQKKVKNEVFQLVWNKLIPTTSQDIKKYKTYDCKRLDSEHWVFDVYLSNNKNIIPTDFFRELNPEELATILNSSKCES